MPPHAPRTLPLMRASFADGACRSLISRLLRLGWRRCGAVPACNVARQFGRYITMKLSQYNIGFDYRGDHYVFNTSSGALVQMTDEFPLGARGEDRDFLVRNRLLVEEGTDEFADVVNRVNSNLARPRSVLSGTVVLTDQCNFRCAYCYQTKHPQWFSADDAERLLRYIDEQTASNVKTIHLNYFGGEPLLNKRELYDIDCGVKQIAKNKGIEYEATISTNGSLLDDKTLAEIEFERIWLTFDGNELHHNQLKQTKSFSYRRQLMLVEKILHEYASNLEIRCNVCKENAESIPEFLNDLTSLPAFSFNRVRICFARLRNEKNSGSFTELSQPEFAHARANYLTVCYGLGMPPALPSPSYLPCEFAAGRAFCFGPGMKTRFCAERLASPDEPKPRRYIARERCKECVVFPLCLGSCTLANDDEACIPERYGLVEQLTAYLAATEQ